MRVAFYAPLKPPDHPTPSGDRRMARLLVEALRQGGHEVELVSHFRSYDGAGDQVRQRRIQRVGGRMAKRLVRRLRRRPVGTRSDAWLTYHAYHKSPDWLGLPVCSALDLPYLLVEASFAPKQADGRWSLGHRASEATIRAADVVLALTQVDVECLAPLVAPPAEVGRLPPFLDSAPFRAAMDARARHREALSARFTLDPSRPWLLAVAMMRADVKRDSYLLLAETLARLEDRDWRLLVIGDGPARPEIEAALRTAAGDPRVTFAGALAESELAAVYAACDLMPWPALREAYGLAMLEAQASGLPVVAGDGIGVAEVVEDGITGLLTPEGDVEAFTAAVAALLDQPGRRREMGRRAAELVACEHGLDDATTRLSAALEAAVLIHARRRPHR